MFNFLNKFFLNKTSRQLQNYQHSVGGFYGILLISSGSFLIKDFWIGVMLGAFSMGVQRISSEISYRTQFKIQEEIKNKYAYKQ
jgi:hypothetical protein